MIITWSLLSWFLTILLVLATTILAYIYNRMNYFERHGIPYQTPRFFKGNMTGKYLTDMKNLYYSFKNNPSPIFGMYILFNPVIVVKNLDLIKNILIKEFYTFPERGFFHNKRDDPLSVHLFNMDRNGWKSTRSKVSPTFTSGKMKHMFSAVNIITERLANVLDEIVTKEADGSSEIEMKEFLARYGTDVIGNVAFGVECNSLKNPNAEFREFGRKAVSTVVANFFSGILKTNYPDIARFFRMKNQAVDVQQFCFQVVKDIMNHRKDSEKRNDFMDFLLEMKKSNENPNGLDFDEIAAHTFVFFVAGFETTSTTMGFALYEMCLNQNVQQQARDEVLRVLEKHNGKMTYECLEEMVYMEQIINETLRMYPPVVELNRRAIQDYPIPDTNLTIENGTHVIIPITNIHRDPEYFTNPDQFMPERFTPEEIKKRHPMTFIPFGDGPRNCVGLRFGKMQTKLGLATLLKNFKFTPGNNLTVPVELHENTVLRQTKHGLWFKLTKLE